MKKIATFLRGVSRGKGTLTRALTSLSLAVSGVLVPWCEALARDWQKIPVPGAKCGNGQPYSIFLSLKDPKRLTVEFQGGGACWNQSTCKGPVPLTNLSPIREVPKTKGGLDSDNPSESPVSSESLVFLPYCTGDVFLGTHVAHYGKSTTVHHVGRLNVEKSLELLNSIGGISLENLESFTFYGSSAGAIGALLHSAHFEAALGKFTRKYLIADAPGLHWGNTFWDRFSEAYRADVSDSLAHYEMVLKPQEGNLAQQMLSLCQRLSDWQVAFLQSDEDFMMSSVFGAISPKAHARLVHSEKGLAAVTKDEFDNCSSWIPASQAHTFMLKNQSSSAKAGGKTALDFVRDVLADEGGKNYSDKP